MPRINGQLIVYLVIGAVLLLVGLSSIRGEKNDSPAFESGGSAAEATGGDSGSLEVTGGSRRLIVDVSGAVRRPGVYQFSHGARVIDAISRAGGVTRQAAVGGINRAATLTDGQQVVVPATVAAGGSASGASVSGATASTRAPVSLGTASMEQLEEIDGIGPVTAQKIIEFRDAQGGLGSVDDLDQISGIGPVTMESLRAALTP